MSDLIAETGTAKQGLLNKPKSFWVVLSGLLGMLVFSLFNWIDIAVDYEFYRGIPVRFNFSYLISGFDDTGLYYLFESMRIYSTSKITSIIVAVLLILSFALLIAAVIKHRSKIFLKLALSGFSLAAFAAVFFMVVTMIFSGAILTSGLTLLPIFVFITALIAMPNLVDPAEIKNKKMSKFIHQKAFFFMIIPVMVYVFIFNYLPLTGWQMAFQQFKPGQDVQEWVGFKHFIFLFTDGAFWRVMQNTLGMSIINLVLSFTTAIFLALMINEIRQKLFKRVVQTISYLPHFLSWVIAAAMIGQFLSSDGILNTILVGLGIYDQPRLFRTEPNSFWWIIGWGNVWKSVGWNTIIYLAAITSIDPELYESAELDGAGRFAKMFYITLPGIKSTILVLLIMSIGWILNAGFEVQYLLGNELTWTKAETIDVFVIRYGIALRNYSLATALGMFKTVVSIILITGANQFSRRFAKESLV